MTRIKYGGFIYLKITKEDWEFEGGETNPDLLKLRHPKRERKTYRYFRLQGGLNAPCEQLPVETETEAALRRWREHGILN